MGRASYHLSEEQNFELSPRFLENLCTPVLTGAREKI
jgi:hypothetical protein